MDTSFFVRSNCWGPVTSENKCAWAPKPCIMRSFGLKMRQKQVWETFRKVCQTCFCAKSAVCCRDFYQKNPRAHKNKIGTSPPKTQNTPFLKRGILWTFGFSCRKSAFFQASIKLTRPFPAPELRRHEAFSELKINALWYSAAAITSTLCYLPVLTTQTCQLQFSH